MELETLWIDYHEQIRHFVHKKIREHNDAEDIVQDVFIMASQGLAQLKDEEKCRAWIYQIARNRIADYYRRHRKTEELTDMAEPEKDEACYSAREAIEGMKSILKKMPDKYREAVELADLKGIPQKELSEFLELSYSGTKSRVQRGREMIKAMMTSCCEIETDRYGNIIEYRVVKDEPVPARRTTRT
ncbi:RNA polymerase sigma factor SigZ [Paenibacillus shunpengii]|uniref:RNA polymerase sigma factor SigZ n=1 Tax=Paenibacillus shunpengii TaxID=2054424 RepID=A0ABW5SM64_9BACL